jgi:hypothetical protein
MRRSLKTALHQIFLAFLVFLSIGTMVSTATAAAPINPEDLLEKHVVKGDVNNQYFMAALELLQEETQLLFSVEAPENMPFTQLLSGIPEKRTLRETLTAMTEKIGAGRFSCVILPAKEEVVLRFSPLPQEDGETTPPGFFPGSGAGNSQPPPGAPGFPQSPGSQSSSGTREGPNRSPQSGDTSATSGTPDNDENNGTGTSRVGKEEEEGPADVNRPPGLDPAKNPNAGPGGMAPPSGAGGRGAGPGPGTRGPGGMDDRGPMGNTWMGPVPFGGDEPPPFGEPTKPKDDNSYREAY